MTSNLLLKLMGQGAVYIRALDCLDGEEDDEYDDLLKAAWEVEGSATDDKSSITENSRMPSTGEGMMN